MYRSLLFPGLILDMEQLSLCRSLEINDNTVASFYGAGGKTSLLLKLASEIAESGSKVLITTTTKMYAPEGLPLFTGVNNHDLISQLREHYKKHSVAVLAESVMADEKLYGVNTTLINKLHDILKIAILIEADGAKGRPLKGHREDEPVIPASTNLIIPVIGADALGAFVDEESVHRVELLLKELPSAGKGQRISEKVIAESFISMGRLGKLQAPAAKIFYLLNKADKLKNYNHAVKNLLFSLKQVDHDQGRLLLTEAKNLYPVKGYFQYGSDNNMHGVSCVLLAAGESKRMGQDKLNLSFDGMSMLETTLKNIYDAGIKDIVVVVKPGSKWLKTLDNKKYKLVENQKYKSGMAESLKAGLNAIAHSSQGVMFALADQPLVTPGLYRNLINHYSKNLDLVTCPVYRGKRGNPVIFDRRTWPLLQKLTGDLGGRAIIGKLPESKIGYMETDLEAVVLDVDTPGEYKSITSKV